ncbi:hypothetical protein [Streptomyces chartreusis]|uniref:hypothetical protein n=1 Tax=Streptomyces chartreusis TaxID=1969 RepID=UPI0036388506
MPHWWWAHYDRPKHDRTPCQAALEDLTVTLLTIAERYAEGRIDDLLDADQLAGVTPAVPRERMPGPRAPRHARTRRTRRM